MQKSIANKTLEDLASPYQTRKTIRFNLLPVSHLSGEINEEEFQRVLELFIEQYKQVVKNFNSIVYIDKENGKTLNPNIKIKQTWLKVYTKQDFYQNKDSWVKNGNKISICEANFLFKIFQNWLNQNWQETEDDETFGGILNQLENVNNQPLNLQHRKSDFAYWIYQIQTRVNIEFICAFFKNIDDKRGGKYDEIINGTNKLLEECRADLVILDNYLLPSQSLGQEVERASLNYYTINKEPKYYQKELEIERRYLHQPCNFTFPKGFIEDLPMFIESLDASKEENIAFIRNVGDLKQTNSWTILQAYNIFKFYKAKQKSNFSEYISQKRSFNDLPKEKGLGLMKDIKEDKFKDFAEITKKIEQLNATRTASTSQIKKLSQKRGKYFNYDFPKYRIFCKFYKNTAVKLGKIKAEIKGLEQEELAARRLKSWAVILGKENQHYLMTIPREGGKLPDAYKKITNIGSEIGEKCWTVYIFESLTLRALEKLCFKTYSNSFIEGIYYELSKKYPQFILQGRVKRRDQFSEDGMEIIKFYQAVLSLESTKKSILIEDYLCSSESKKLLTDQFFSLRDFQSTLEKICYIRREVKISERTKNELQEKYNAQIYKITSYDLEKERKNPEEHTKIWNKYWAQDEKSGYTIRLNPELKINYVEKRAENIKDKGGVEVPRNRRKQAEYILSMTISENNDKPQPELTFSSRDDIRENIDKFNDALNKKLSEDPYGIYYYGIDRGQKELGTLGIYRFEDYDISVQGWDDQGKKQMERTYKKPKPIALSVFELPKEKLRQKISYRTSEGERFFEAYKNISQCEFLLAEKKIISCLDLNCAKMINGKIVINGDIASYLQLKKIAAMRKITDGIARHQFIGNKLQKDGNVIYLEEENRGKIERVNIYHIDDKFDELISSDGIKTELQEHFDKIRKGNAEKDIYTIEKINHLRDAICANAVGIISHLLQKYPGMISIENMKIETKQEHFDRNNANLGSRIEMAMLNKFKTFGVVPPTFRMVIGMQSNKIIEQLGIIKYVPIEDSSRQCPYCETMIDKETKNRNKWSGQFQCSNNGHSCGFKTHGNESHKEFGFIKNPDDVATYNLAKRGLNFVISNK